MKTPLHYQMTEYDCGPITVMNAIIYLFEREQTHRISSAISCSTALMATARRGTRKKRYDARSHDVPQQLSVQLWPHRAA